MLHFLFVIFVQCNDDTLGEKKGWINPVSHCRVTKHFSLLWLRNCGVFHFEEGKKFSVSAPTLHKICKLKVTFRKGLNHSFEKRFQIMVRYLFFNAHLVNDWSESRAKTFLSRASLVELTRSAAGFIRER